MTYVQKTRTYNVDEIDTLEIHVLDDVDELVNTSLTIVKNIYKLNI
jgi:hypothetical protein